MRTIAKLAICIFFAGTVTTAFAQQSTTTKKGNTKQKSTKQKKEIDNKIAASDEAQTADKGAKKGTTKSSGISNK